MSESDLGPIVGSLEPMKPIHKPLLLVDNTCALQRAAGLVLGIVGLFVVGCIGGLLWALFKVYPPAGM